MTPAPHGPGTPYTLLFDDDTTIGPGLPAAFQSIYGGDWQLPAVGARPYTFTNFVASRDGRIAFGATDGGGKISRNAPHDKWLMALLRARADAILIAPSALRVARKRYWTPEAVFAADAPAFDALRADEQRAALPLLVILTRTGDLPTDALVLQEPRQPILIATTVQGAMRAQHILKKRHDISYSVSSGQDVDFEQLLNELRTEYNITTLLSEGGATVYGALIQAGVIDEEFLTVSPIIVGSPSPPASPRTSLVEGVAFDADNPPMVDLVSVRRFESYLFQRSRYRRSSE